jgi:UDP-N-acetylglucosamine 2-epimerase (non-hydrolysing)
MKIINIVGARPNFMKIAPLMEAYKKSAEINPLLLHTGQHYDSKMSELFFEELKIPKPDIYLNIGSDTQAKQVARIMMAFEDVCLAEKPDAILVVGDVNSTMACSLVACKMGIKIIHLEAGLRSFDRTMPEEINRIITDKLADILLTPSLDANENLKKEGVSDDKIHLVGNIMVDTLLKFLPLAEKSDILEKLQLKPKQYLLVTLHRPSNVDDMISLQPILQTLDLLSQKIQIVFPVHPRTLKNIFLYKLEHLLKNLIITEPLGYFDFQKLMFDSRLVITDSGGIQEETTVLKIPCITLRENTERPVTITEGSNELAGSEMEKLKFFTEKVINSNWKQSNVPKLWDGNTAHRVVDVIIEKLGK